MMTTVAERLVTATDIAQATSLEPETILALAREGRIPAHRLGRKIVRFRLSEVLNVLVSTQAPGSPEVRP